MHTLVSHKRLSLIGVPTSPWRRTAGRRLLALWLGAVAAVGGATADARDYTGTIRVLVGFPAGGATDIVARTLSERLRDALGQPVIIENKGGAGGMIATQQLKSSPADGSTVMLTIDHSHVIVPLTFKAPGYDPLKDFTPLAGVASYYNIVAVSNTIGVSDVKGFGAWLKANPGSSNIGVPAPGSVPQFAALILGKSLGVTVVPVPYRGGAPLVADVIAGQVPAGIGSLTEYIDHQRAGKLKILAASGLTRPETAPEIPTFRELGVANLDVNPWLAFFGPKDMPAEFVERFSKAVAGVLAAPDIRERLLKMGNVPTYATPEQLQQWVVSATEHWRPVIQESGFEMQ